MGVSTCTLKGGGGGGGAYLKAGMGVSTCLFNSLWSRVHSLVSTIHGEGWEGGAESEGRKGGRRGIECVSCGPLIS